MANTYHLTGYDEESNVIVDLELSADQAVELLVEAVNRPSAKTEPFPVQVAQERPRKIKGGRPPKKVVKDEKPRKQGKTRELVVQLRVAGKSVDEIAAEIGKSRSTVLYHLASDAGASTKNWEHGKKGRATVEPLTEDQYDDLKHAQQFSDGFSSHAYAAKHGLALAEVNKAITSRSYADYCQW